MGITDPSEEYFKDGLWGWVAPAWKKLVAEAAGQLHVYLAGQAAAIEVTQTTPADLVAAAHGWDGAAWRKLPIVWGYSARYAKEATGLAAGAGNALAELEEVDAGEVWVIEAFTVDHNAGVAKNTRAYLYDGATWASLLNDEATVSDVFRLWQGRITLAEGDTLSAVATAPGDGKQVRIRAWGYKMKVAE